MSILLAAANRGATAATNGVPYEDNPYCRKRQADAHLAWSKSHNAMRVQMAIAREKLTVH